MEYKSQGARILRETTQTLPHVWCERFGWHDAVETHDGEEA